MQHSFEERRSRFVPPGAVGVDEERLLESAVLLGQLDRVEEALAICREIQLHGTARLEAWKLACDLHFSQGRFEEALRASEEALSLADRVDPLLYTKHGTILSALDRHEEALSSFERACTLAPGEPLMWMNLASALCAVGRHEAALAHFDRALALDPDQEQAMMLLYGKGEALIALGRPAAGLHLFEEAIRIERGVLSGALSANAGALFEELLALLYAARGEVQVALGDLLGARASLDQALAFRPCAETQDLLGQVQRALRSAVST